VSAKIQADAVVGGKEFVLNSCGNNTITFQNQSQQEAFIKSYHWIFNINGNKVEQTTRNATYTFPGVGNYQGTMIVNEGEQCGDTAFINVNVYPSIHTDFEFDYDTCIGGPVNFTDLSVTNAQNLTNWNWSFGDGKTDTIAIPIISTRNLVFTR
jgi:PKD repeat protein